VNTSNPGASMSPEAEVVAGPTGTRSAACGPPNAADQDLNGVRSGGSCAVRVTTWQEQLDAPYSARQWWTVRGPSAGRPLNRRIRPGAVRRLGP
jgi:hypothetical protein